MAGPIVTKFGVWWPCIDAYPTGHGWYASGRVHLHTCRCSPAFLISGTTGRIALKFGVCLEINDMRFTLLRGGVLVCTCAPLFRISGTAGRITLNFATSLETS